jgi:MoxR-like ATPase
MTAQTPRAVALAIAAKVPAILWGAPGSGKTSAVVAMAEAAGLPCEIVIASIREPSDFAGLPVVSDGKVSMAPPAWATRLSEAGRGILFLDEISTAPPAVQAALLRVVLERAVGDLQLPEDVVVIAAANPPEMAADGWDLAAPLANRFCHLDWTLDARTWANGIVGGFAVETIPELNSDELRAASYRHRSQAAGFLASRSGFLSMPPDDATRAGRAWPSPRSWEMSATLSAAAELIGADRELVAELTAGAVGPAAALEFRAWLDEAALPDAEAALLDPGSFRLPDRGDRAYAALSAIVAAVRSNNTPARWSAAWAAIAAGVQAGQTDIAVAAMRPLIEHRPAGALPPPEALTVVAPVLRAAGLFDRLLRDSG